MSRLKDLILCFLCLLTIMSCKDNEETTTPNDDTDDGTSMKGTLTYPIVDTGVKEFSSNDAKLSVAPKEGDDFYGQDATYDGNQPSYTDNNDGTITDKVTGLMWEKDMGMKISAEDAVTKAKNLTTGEHTDWRIPTIKELYSLAKFDGVVFGEQARENFIDDVFNQPIGDTTKGEREIDAQTWSSTAYIGQIMTGTEAIFGFNFVDGRLKGYPKIKGASVANKLYFRMVRGNAAYGKNNFMDNGDGTISDAATGLMWQTADDGNTYDWKSGLKYAENLALAGHSDWRMPNAKELHSIVDYTRSPSASNSPAIDPLFTYTKIKDLDGNNQYGYYWTSTQLKDGPSPYTDAVYIAFGKAQGKFKVGGSASAQLLDVHGAGAQRNDPKSGDKSDFPDFFGPQGDVRYVYNFVRCVRDL